MKINLKVLKNVTPQKPVGYYDDVLSHGIVKGDFLEITQQEYKALCLKYSGQYIEPTNGCCGKAGEKPLPPIATQARNALKSVGRVVSASFTGNRVKASDEIIAKRKEVCMGCEFLKDESRCIKCGCFYKAKITLAPERCPVGKW